MIIKRGEKVPGLQKFTRRHGTVMAKQMREDFMIETGSGWMNGKRGEWLVLIGEDLWCAVEDKQFRRIYEPALDSEDPL